MTRVIETGTTQLPATVDDLGIVRVVLTNPESHNSLTSEMMRALPRVLDTASSDPTIRAVLVRGDGDRAFASGADIGEQSDRTDRGERNPDRGDYMARLMSCTKPVVAMIHGYCIGGGLMVAMAADIRIASEDAVFSVPAGRLGVAYPISAIQVLVDLVGRSWATDLALSADHIGAATAHHMGLVTRVHPKDRLEAATEELLRTLVANAPLSAVASKASIAHASEALRPPIGPVIDTIDAVWRSADAAEGMQAFLEKRSARWQGR